MRHLSHGASRRTPMLRLAQATTNDCTTEGGTAPGIPHFSQPQSRIRSRSSSPRNFALKTNANVHAYDYARTRTRRTHPCPLSTDVPTPTAPTSWHVYVCAPSIGLHMQCRTGEVVVRWGGS